MPEVQTWQHGQPLESFAPARQHLFEGRLVVLPSEAGYLGIARALCPEAVGRLQALASPQTPLTLLLSDSLQVFDWLPLLKGVSFRLARSFWPGPFTLIGSSRWTSGLMDRLPEGTRALLCPERRLALRVPSHEAPRQLATYLGEPLVSVSLPSLPQEADPAQTFAEFAFAVTDGPTLHQAFPTIVEIEGGNWSLKHEGVIPRTEVEEAIPCRIVFVCTGNTCRSPLAQAICEKLLSERLGCQISELKQRGFCVHSAGIAAMIGAEATAEAIETATALGADLTGHRSQPLSLELLERADFLITMTYGHLRLIWDLTAPLGLHPRLLSRTGKDIDDPIGCDAAVYRACAEQIQTELVALLPEILES